MRQHAEHFRLAPTQAWRVLLELARKLKAVVSAPTDVETLRPAFEEMFLKRMASGGHPAFATERAEERWIEFEHHFNRARVPVEADPWDLAVQKAQTEPIELVPNLGKDCQQTASIAYHLGLMPGGDKHIVLPVAKIAAVLGKEMKHATRVIDLLRRRGLLELVDGTYGPRKPKKHRFNLNSKAYRPPSDTKASTPWTTTKRSGASFSSPKERHP